jgi:hypothetical protein
MRTAFLVTEFTGENEVVGIVFPKDTIEETLTSVKQALADHFDVDVDTVDVVNGESLAKGIKPWDNERFEVNFGDDDDTQVITVQSVYIY